MKRIRFTKGRTPFKEPDEPVPEAEVIRRIGFLKGERFLKTSAERVASGGPSYCGSIWSGRFKSTLIEGGRYLATCIRYVELNPVRAGMVSQAKNYAYSSANEPKPSEIGDFAGCVPFGGVCVARMEECGCGGSVSPVCRERQVDCAAEKDEGLNV